ncbi:hypothetical protein BT69DRAFT_856743 [Atractiella rhizophila]|nr:hypothetical protein BT69DRAFT_856743 [Atractiella rhizophila]
MAYNSSDFDRNDSGEVINNNIFDIDFEDLDLLGKNGGSEGGNGTKVGEGSYFPTYGLDGGVGGMDWESSTGGVMDSMLGSNSTDFDFGPLDLSKTDFSKHFNTVPVNTNEEDAAFLGSSSAAAWSVYMSPAVFTPFNHPPSSVFDYLPEPTSSYLESDAHPTNLFDNDPLFGTPHPLLGGSNLSTPADDPLPITPLTDGNARQPAIRQNSNAGSMAQFDMSSVMGSATQFDINSPIIGMNDISMDFPNASLFPSLFNNKKRYSPVGTSSSLSAPPVFPQASTSLSAPPVFPQASTSSPVVPMLSPAPMMSPAPRPTLGRRSRLMRRLSRGRT